MLVKAAFGGGGKGMHVVRDADHLEEALRRAAEYGKPRWPSIREYAQLIGFSAEEALHPPSGTPRFATPGELADAYETEEIARFPDQRARQGGRHV